MTDALHRAAFISACKVLGHAELSLPDGIRALAPSSDSETSAFPAVLLPSKPRKHEPRALPSSQEVKAHLLVPLISSVTFLEGQEGKNLY